MFVNVAKTYLPLSEKIPHLTNFLSNFFSISTSLKTKTFLFRLLNKSIIRVEQPDVALDEDEEASTPILSFDIDIWFGNRVKLSKERINVHYY
jgi:hypothetical protein